MRTTATRCKGSSGRGLVPIDIVEDDAVVPNMEAVEAIDDTLSFVDEDSDTAVPIAIVIAIVPA